MCVFVCVCYKLHLKDFHIILPCQFFRVSPTGPFFAILHTGLQNKVLSVFIFDKIFRFSTKQIILKTAVGFSCGDFCKLMFLPKTTPCMLGICFVPELCQKLYKSLDLTYLPEHHTKYIYAVSLLIQLLGIFLI